MLYNDILEQYNIDEALEEGRMSNSERKRKQERGVSLREYVKVQ